MGDHMQDVELSANAGRAMDTGFMKNGAGANELFGTRTQIIELVLRVFIAVLTVISLSLIASDPGFNTVPAFNYLLGTAVLSFLYCFFQSLIAGYHFVSSGQSLLPAACQVYSTAVADLVCSILLLSGSSAAFGVTTSANYTDNFIGQVNGSASFAFIAFICTLPSVVISSSRLSGK